MAQTTFSLRMDDNLKRQFDIMCSDFGMTASTAFNIFARAVVRQRKIPFEITSSRIVAPAGTGYSAFMASRDDESRNDLQDLTLEEIIDIISAVRADVENTDEQ